MHYGQLNHLLSSITGQRKQGAKASNVKKWLICLVLAPLTFVLALAPIILLNLSSASAQISRQMPLNAAFKATGTGAAVPDGSYTLTFKLYTAETGGTATWTETQTISVTGGVLSVRLGAVTAFPTTLTFEGSEYYLGVTVSGESEMSPRLRIGAVPTAFNADTVDGASAGTSANNVLKLDSSGNISIAGAITGGTWQSTAIAAIYGGTGQTTYTIGDLLYASSATAISKLGIGTAGQCLGVTGTTPTWGGCGASTLQAAYDGTGGNSITTSTARDFDIVLADTASDSNLDVQIATNSTSTVSISRLAGSGTANPSQLLLVEDLDADLTIADGLTVRTAGVLTDAIDLSDPEIVNALNIGLNNIITAATTIASTELDRLDGKDAALIDTNDAVSTAITGLGTIASGVWNGTAILDTYVADTLTTDISSALQWAGLTGYPTACSAGSAVSTLADTPTCTSFNTDTSITLQDAYNAASGSSITTTSARDIDIVLADNVTDSNLDIVIATNSTSTVSITRADGTSTGTNPTQLLLVEDLEDDISQIPIDNGILIRATALGLTDAIDVTDTDIVNAINIGTNVLLGTTGDINLNNFDVTGSTGTITTAGGYTQSGTVANAFTGASSFTATGTALSVTNTASIGVLSVTGTSTLAGDITFSATTPNIAINNTETLTVTDGSNTLFTLADGGTTGNGTFSGNLTLQGTTGATLSGAGAGLAFSGTGNHALSTSSTDLRLQPSTGISLFNTASTNNIIRIYGSGGSNYAQLTHDNTNTILSASSGEVQLSGTGTNQFVIGDVGTAVNLVFEESSTISGQGANTITVGQSGDIFSLNVTGATYNVGTLAATGATLNTSSTSTTALTINGPTSLTSNLLDLQVNGSSKASVNASGDLTAAKGTFTGDLTVDTNTLFVDSTNNRVGVLDTTPDYTLEVSQAIGSDSTLALSDGDVAHGLTTLAQTDVWWYSAPLSSTAGGGQLTVISDTNAAALEIRGVIGSTDPTDTTPAVKLIGGKASGTNIADLGAAETVLQIANNDDTAALTVLGNAAVGIGDATPASLFTVGSGDLLQVTTNGDLTLAPSIRTTGSPTLLTVTGPAHTTLTASTEATDINLNLARTVQFAAGALTTQRAIRVQAPTYGFVSSSTLTTAITLQVAAAPTAGSSATITNAVALDVGGATTQVSAAGLVYNAVRVPDHTLTATGTTQVTSSSTAAVAIGQLTITDASALTYDNASSLYIAAAPVQAGSVTLTNAYALWVDAGTVRFDGRVNTAKSADVASGGTITLGAGNYAVITGTTNIDYLTTTGWTAGSQVTLEFAAILTVNDNTGSVPANTAAFDLAGSFTTTAGDTLTVTYNGTKWVEIARSIN